MCLSICLPNEHVVENMQATYIDENYGKTVKVIEYVYRKVAHTLLSFSFENLKYLIW